jgi:uncharacterized protein involved in exopolysaccharide biosynthesis
MAESPSPAMDDKETSTSLQDIIIPIWAERKRILLISSVAALLTLGINFLLPVYYKSTATLLPETQKDKLSSLGQFADIASLAGVSVPGSEIARLYPVILSSETILRSVIQRKYKSNIFPDSIDLIRYFDYSDYPADQGMAKTLAKLKGLLIATHDNKTSVVSVSAEMPEPVLAATVLNTAVDELDRFMRSKRVTSASEQVKWIAIRIKEVDTEMKASEERLKDFRERNRRVIDSPQLLLEQERLTRDVQGVVFVELKKQFELAKLEEIKNISIVNILDPGRPPVKKERPSRLVNTVIVFLLSFVFSSAFYATRRIYGSNVSEFLKSLDMRGEKP